MSEQPAPLGDWTFVTAFETGRLPPSQFGHRDHVRLGYLYLHKHGLGGAIERMTSGLKRYVKRLGQDAKYHETMTVAFLALINERLAVDDPGDWDRFAARNPDLFDKGLLAAYYPQSVLETEKARTTFVLSPRSGAVL